MIRGGTIWYQPDVCAKQDRCSIAYYPMSSLSKSYQIFIDRAVDTSGHIKDVVNGFNDAHKRYLATFWIMRSTPEVYNIDSKRMRVDAMTENGEVIFA